MEPDESQDEAAMIAAKHVRNARAEMWGWVIFLPIYLAVPALRESVAIVGVLSIYALVISAKGVVRAGQAEVAGYDNP